MTDYVNLKTFNVSTARALTQDSEPNPMMSLPPALFLTFRRNARSPRADNPHGWTQPPP